MALEEVETVSERIEILSDGEISDFKFEDTGSDDGSSTGSSTQSTIQDKRPEQDHIVKDLPVEKEERIEPFDPKSVPIDSKYLQCGQVISDLQNLLIIKTSSGEERVLEVGSVIFDDTKTPIGRISDIWGPVKDPLYSVTKFEKSANLLSNEEVGPEVCCDDVKKENEISNEEKCAEIGSTAKPDIMDTPSTQIMPVNEGCKIPEEVVSDEKLPWIADAEEVRTPCEDDLSTGKKLEASADSTIVSLAPVPSAVPFTFVGKIAYYVADLAEVVFTAPLKALKGTDASNLYDQEADHPEFSDDEQERAYKLSLKKSNAQIEHSMDSIPTSSSKPKRKATETMPKNQRKPFDNNQQWPPRKAFGHQNQQLHQRNQARSVPFNHRIHGNVQPPVFAEPSGQNGNPYVPSQNFMQQQPQSQMQSLVQGRNYNSSLQMEAQTKLLAQIQASQYQYQMQQLMAVPGSHSSPNHSSFPLPATIELRQQQNLNNETCNQVNPFHAVQTNTDAHQAHSYQNQFSRPQQISSQFPQQAIQFNGTSSFPYHYGQHRAMHQPHEPEQSRFQPQHQPPIYEQFRQPNHQLFQQTLSSEQYQPQHLSDLPSAYQIPNQSQPAYSSNRRLHPTEKNPQTNHQIPTPQPSPVPPVSEDQRKQLDELARFLQQ